jgi:hypothetical protein
MSAFRAALQSARKTSAVNGGSVLDALLSMPHPERSQLEADLASVGVRLALDADGFEPDFGELSREVAVGLGVVPFRQAGADRVYYGMADPWDEAAVQRLIGTLGFMPMLTRTGSWLARSVTRRRPRSPCNQPLPAIRC